MTIQLTGETQNQGRATESGNLKGTPIPKRSKFKFDTRAKKIQESITVTAFSKEKKRNMRSLTEEHVILGIWSLYLSRYIQSSIIVSTSAKSSYTKHKIPTCHSAL